MTEEYPRNTVVRKTGYGWTGVVYRYEDKYRTRWAVVHWDGAQFTDREYPHAIEALPEGEPRRRRPN